MKEKLIINKKSLKGEDGYKTFSIRIKDETVEKLAKLIVENKRCLMEYIVDFKPFISKDNNDLSLVNALNIKVSEDGSCLSNEESIKENNYIKNYINNYFISTNQEFNNIITIIPCNNELVIFATGTQDVHHIYIFRYKEKTDFQEEDIYLAYGDNLLYYLKYHGGKIKGTYTYNINNDIICYLYILSFFLSHYLFNK